MAASSLDYFIHAANILLLAAYSVRDILWLRALAVASSLAAIPYFLLQPTPLWAAFGWSVLFTGINIFQAWRLVVERRPVKLTAEEEEIRALVFRDLPPKKVLQVIGIGTWVSAAAGEPLIERGKPLESIALIVRGKVQVTKEGRVLGALGPGDIVGSALLLSGAREEIDAVTTEATRTLRWTAATLERYLDANPETRNLFQGHLARDLAGKVERLGRSLQDGDLKMWQRLRDVQTRGRIQAEAAATYADPIALSASAIVVAPGGLWPKLTNAQQAIQPSRVETDESARTQRLAWLTRQYTSGRLLVAFGFDRLHLGQQELFKGMRFASTDQASVIWFGSTGAEYAPPKALWSDKNLITAKPLLGVDEAIGLLQRSKGSE